MERLALIIDKELAYVYYQKHELLKEWAVSTDNVENASSLKAPPGTSLFGDTPLVVHELNTPTEGKNAVAALERKTSEELQSAYPTGLIITTQKLNRNQTKKLEGIIKRLGGRVLATNGKNDAPLSVRLLNDLALPTEVKQFLHTYMGEDHELVLPLAANLSRLPKAQQRRLTVEDMALRLPRAPGSIPPWDLEDPLFEGDIPKVISLYRRLEQHGKSILLVVLLKNKFTNYYKVGCLLQGNPRLKDEEITTALKLPSRGFFFTKKRVKAYPVETLQECLEIITRWENDLKGGSNAPTDALSEVALVELCYRLRK